MRKDQISNPRVLFVTFENQGGDWAVKIPHAYGKDQHFSAPIDENLSLQFQPTHMANLLKGEQVVGVACIALIEEQKEDNGDVKPKPAQTA